MKFADRWVRDRVLRASLDAEGRTKLGRTELGRRRRDVRQSNRPEIQVLKRDENLACGVAKGPRVRTSLGTQENCSLPAAISCFFAPQFFCNLAFVCIPSESEETPDWRVSHSALAEKSFGESHHNLTVGNTATAH